MYTRSSISDRCWCACSSRWRGAPPRGRRNQNRVPVVSRTRFIALTCLTKQLLSHEILRTPRDRRGRARLRDRVSDGRAFAGTGTSGATQPLAALREDLPCYGGACTRWHPPYRKLIPHPFLVANRLVSGKLRNRFVRARVRPTPFRNSYRKSPAAVRGRRHVRTTPLGRYSFRYLKGDMQRGYRLVNLGSGQSAFVASPEKAFLDNGSLCNLAAMIPRGSESSA